MSMSPLDAELLVVERLKTVIPVLANSIIPELDRPDDFSEKILKDKHPRGLMLVQYQESEGVDSLNEMLVIGVYCCAFTIARTLKLCQAARIALNKWQSDNSARFEFHKDEAIGSEKGMFVRNVQFRTMTPATPPRDLSTAITALNL